MFRLIVSILMVFSLFQLYQYERQEAINQTIGINSALFPVEMINIVKYRDLVKQKARKHGLNPELFLRQIFHESGLNPNARSPVGALGIAQIMPATARSWGINPLDPNEALDAAANNMAQNIRTYQRRYGKQKAVKCALAAYNAGPGAVAKYNCEVPYRETRNYVANITRGIQF